MFIAGTILGARAPRDPWGLRPASRRAAGTIMLWKGDQFRRSDLLRSSRFLKWPSLISHPLPSNRTYETSCLTLSNWTNLGLFRFWFFKWLFPVIDMNLYNHITTLQLFHHIYVFILYSGKRSPRYPLLKHLVLFVDNTTWNVVFIWWLYLNKWLHLKYNKDRHISFFYRSAFNAYFHTHSTEKDRITLCSINKWV